MKGAPLTPKGLETYHYVPVPKNKEPEKDYKGIEFGPLQIYNIFQNLSSLIDAEPVPLPEDSNISFIDPDHLKNSYGEPESFMWFTADIPAVVAAAPSMSWYQKFSAAASSTLLQMVWLSLELKDLRGRKQMFNLESQRRVLMSVPTEPWLEDNPFPAFPIGTDPLDAWIAHFKETIPEFTTPPPPPSVNDFNKGLSKRYTSIVDGIPAEVPPKDLEAWGQEGEAIEGSMMRDLISTAAQDGHDISNVDLSHFSDVASIPPARIHPPVWTPFLTKFAYANVYGQSALMHRALEAEERRMGYLIQNCQSRLTVLERAKAELAVKTESLENVRKEMDRKYGILQQTEKEVAVMKQTVQEASEDPEIAGFLRQEYETKRGDSGQQPFMPFPMSFGYPSQQVLQQQWAAAALQYQQQQFQQPYGSPSIPFSTYLPVLSD